MDEIDFVRFAQRKRAFSVVAGQKRRLFSGAPHGSEDGEEEGGDDRPERESVHVHVVLVDPVAAVRKRLRHTTTTTIYITSISIISISSKC